jgi:hypothetical protein
MRHRRVSCPPVAVAGRPRALCLNEETDVDNFAQLALMTKAKLVFESENTFLSFPALSPLSYPPDRLKFSMADGLTAQELSDLSEFARITNRIPRTVLAPVEEGEYLWDVYQNVLHTAQRPAGVLSAPEQARYDAAMAVLYTDSAEGLRQPSPMLTAYCQYRDAHIKAQEDYKNCQFTAESSADPAVQAQWQNMDEPRLRQEVQRLEREWLTQGFRAQVEEAQQIEQACNARAPSRAWDEWQKAFIDDLDKDTDTNQIRYAETGFSPSDLFDMGSWLRFTLTNAEMTRLIQQAPPELQAIYGSDLATPSVDSVSFEYRSVALTRPWFRPALFRARFWRLGTSGGELSDGGNPPQGECPAYIAALVFARNVTIQYRQQMGAPTPKVEKPGTLLTLAPNIQLRQLSLARATAMSPHMVSKVGGAAATRGVSVQPRVALAGPQKALLLKSHTFRALEHIQVRRPISTPGPRPSPTPRPAPAPAPAPVPAPPPAQPTDEVTILAFICKRLPRCPDPDPALTWV